MGKHLDYVQQSDGTYKWQLAEIPAVKSTPAEKPKPEAKKKPSIFLLSMLESNHQK